jgi:hypothetical protein
MVDAVLLLRSSVLLMAVTTKAHDPPMHELAVHVVLGGLQNVPSVMFTTIVNVPFAQVLYVLL